MKSLALSLLFLCSSCSVGSIEYPDLIESYLKLVKFEDQEQHDRIERVLLYLEGLDKEDMEFVATYLCMLLDNQPASTGLDCGCDSCCDSLIDEEFATCGVKDCCGS